MNRADLKLLQSLESYPSITITLPTHRTSPDNKQDPIRVRNLLKLAAEKLTAEAGDQDVKHLIEELDYIAEDIDYMHALDGLAIFVSNQVSRKFYLPFTLAERVVIDPTFYTRDLVFALNRSPRYRVVALSEQPTRLFEGLRDDLDEIRTAGFPFFHGGPGGATTLPDDPSVNRSLYRDEHHRTFFRTVDNALGTVHAADPLPLVLVGVDRYISFFREVSRHTDSIIATWRGNHDRTSAHDLGKLIWPEVEQAFAAQRTHILTDLNDAVGAHRSASTIGEVWRKAREGRGAVLVVEEGFHYPARVTADGMGLEPIETPTTPEDLDDAVDEAIEAVLTMGGRVVFVADGTLAQHSRIALILRY